MRLRKRKKIDIPSRWFASTHESAFHLATENAAALGARQPSLGAPSPSIHPSIHPCVPLRSSLVVVDSFSLPSSPAIARVSRFAIYSSSRKNECRVARIHLALPLFSLPFGGGISRVIIGSLDRRVFRGWHRFLLTKLANGI